MALFYACFQYIEQSLLREVWLNLMPSSFHQPTHWLRRCQTWMCEVSWVTDSYELILTILKEATSSAFQSLSSHFWSNHFFLLSELFHVICHLPLTTYICLYLLCTVVSAKLAFHQGYGVTSSILFVINKIFKGFIWKWLSLKNL